MTKHIPTEQIQQLIVWVRGQKVILASELAALYGVTTSHLNEQVKRNRKRFPEGFVFQLTLEEYKVLTSQFAMSKGGRGGRRVLPYAFTEHGAVMASMVLNSPRAVQVSVEVVRTFVRMRQMAASNVEFSRKLDELERKYDVQFKVVFDAIRKLMSSPSVPRRRIGFHVKEPEVGYALV